MVWQDKHSSNFSLSFMSEEMSKDFIEKTLDKDGFGLCTFDLI